MVDSSQWKVIFFRMDDGIEPVKKYIDNQNHPKEKAVLLKTIKMLRDNGPDIQGTKMDKLIEGSLRELRKGRHRIFYGRNENTFVLLCAYLKETDDAPPEQIQLAKDYFTQYQKRIRKAN